MAPFRALLAVAGAALGASLTPVEKVITLLEDLRTEVEVEGKAEAKTYDTFACFCKDTTMTKSKAVTDGRDNIDSLSATIQEKTAEREAKEAELKERKQDHEKWTADLEDTKVRFEKATAEYDAQAADLSKAISSLDSAIKAMEASKPASLIELRASVEQGLATAVALGRMPEQKRRKVSEMLQSAAKVDPADPSYQYHSQGILDTLADLLKDFRTEKEELDSEWAKAKATYESTIADLEEKIRLNEKAMDELETSIETLKGEIAQARGDLVSAEGLLKDDQLYLKDLTQRCEDRAHDWDQRSQMRADELEALTGALDILKGDVKTLDASANERALLQRAPAQTPARPQEKDKVDVPISRHAVPVLLQVQAAGRGHAAALRGSSARVRQDRIVAFLGQEGQRLGSTSLSSLAMHLAADPFGKVKTLIQQLIERLLAEATAEATKKGFCDTEVSKAEEERAFRLSDVKKLMVELEALNIKKDELESEIEVLTGAVETLRDDLNKTTVQRKVEREENIQTMKEAKEGVAVVKEAIAILKAFYKKGAKAASFVQFSPVDEDTQGAGFSGAYAGKQESSKGIIGMLEVIASDFDRTNRHTDEAEQKAHEEFVEFDRVSRADISGKETKIALDKEDLESTVNKIAQGLDDLETEQGLLDSALKRLEDLKPTCIDTGMSYADRFAKREEEVAALKRALCILDTENVEADCQ